MGSPGLAASDITVPACVHWHVCDGCSVSTPLGAQNYLNALALSGSAAGGGSMSGGFDQPNADVCEAQTVHGFFGIESCAVDQIVQCLSSIPIVPKLEFDDYFYPEFVPGGTVARFSLREAIGPRRGARRLTFRLLDDGLGNSHGGRLTIARNGLVRFFTPFVSQDAVAKFAYEVTDHLGRVGIGVVAINLVPNTR